MIDNTVAIIDDNQSIHFSNLTKIVNRTAKYYFENGIVENSTVAILANNSLEYVITVYALWKLGATPAPISTRLKENEINAIIQSSGFNHIIVDKSFSQKKTQIKSIKMLIKLEGDEYSKSIEVSPNDVAVIIHTSGSSGKPKGVEITNSNLYHSFLSLSNAFKFNSSDVFLASLPFYHIGGFAIISRALLSGGVLVIPKTLKQKDIVDTCTKFEPTVVSLVPTMLARIIDGGVKPNSNMRHLFLGGGASSDELIRSALINNWPIVKVYGSSETTAMVSGCWGNDLSLHPACGGKSFDNVEIIILDEQKEEIKKNAVGEIAVKSPTIARGYLNNNNLWNKKIHDGYYLTGDYGYLDEENRLFVVARRTDLIVSGGENIDPREIEKVLTQHSKIKEAIVFPMQNNEWGQVAVALVTVNKKSLLGQEELTAYLKSKLASFKVPKTILIVTEIPKTELGKIDLERCKSLILKGS